MAHHRRDSLPPVTRCAAHAAICTARIGVLATATSTLGREEKKARHSPVLILRPHSALDAARYL